MTTTSLRPPSIALAERTTELFALSSSDASARLLPRAHSRPLLGARVAYRFFNTWQHSLAFDECTGRDSRVGLLLSAADDVVRRYATCC